LPLTTSTSRFRQPSTILVKPERFRFSARRRRSSSTWTVSTSACRASMSRSSSWNWRSVAAMICWYSTYPTSMRTGRYLVGSKLKDLI
jgi:hypothetical protein